MNEINEQILEVRYSPNSKIIDNRGKRAEEIAEHMKMSEWRIVGNRVDVFNKENRDRTFYGFRNSGFSCNYSPTHNYFSDQANKYIKLIYQFVEFGKTPFIERIGVRSKFCNIFNGKFDELVALYEKNYMGLTDKAKRTINARVVDLGAPWNFADDLGNFNTHCGPMIKDQISQFFEYVKEETIPDVGLFYDIDYWVRPMKEMKEQEIMTMISKFAERIWKRNEDIKKIILEA
jgi:hypothetical protein